MKNTEKKYLVQIELDGETVSGMMTADELSRKYEEEDDCGIGMHFSAWDVDSFGTMVSVNVYDLVWDIIKARRWAREEYWQYCEEERYN